MLRSGRHTAHRAPMPVGPRSCHEATAIARARTYVETTYRPEGVEYIPASDRGQEGAEPPFPLQPQLLPDVVAMHLDGAHGAEHDVGHLLGIAVELQQAADTELGGRERREALGEHPDEIGIDHAHLLLEILPVLLGSAAGVDQIDDILHHIALLPATLAAQLLHLRLQRVEQLIFLNQMERLRHELVLLDLHIGLELFGPEPEYLQLSLGARDIEKHLEPRQLLLFFLPRQLVPQLAWKRSWLNLLRTRGDRLDAEQRSELAVLWRQQPVLQPIYELKERLCALLCIRSQTKLECRAHVAALLRFIGTLRDSGFELAQTLAKTLQDWSEEIARMWRFTRNNGITEGFHRKMKLIQRRAYGFRNFNNYRLRVIAQCG